MLNIYRRHRKNCKHRSKGRDYRRCQCPIWIDGSLAGREIRKTLGTRGWTEASRQVQEWEAAEQISERGAPMSLGDAWDNLVVDLEARKLSSQTIRKYKLLQRQMTAYGGERGVTLLSQFDLDTLSRFRATWTDGTRSSGKKLERLRAFFAFCHDRNWVEANHAKKLKSPKFDVAQTMPLSHEEMVKLLAAADSLILTAQPSAKLNAHRLRTLVLLMRYTGLRISDAVALTTDRLDGNKLFLSMQKTGEPLYSVLPSFLVRALEETPRVTNTRSLLVWPGQAGNRCVRLAREDEEPIQCGGNQEGPNQRSQSSFAGHVRGGAAAGRRAPGARFHPTGAQVHQDHREALQPVDSFPARTDRSGSNRGVETGSIAHPNEGYIFRTRYKGSR